MTFPVGNPSVAPVPATKRRTDLIPARWQPAILVPGVLVGLMTIVQIVNSFPADWLNSYGGIEPRSTEGLVGIVTAPLLHGSWAHLLSNAIPLLIFGFLVMVNGVKQFVAVTVLVWLVSGLGVWLTSGTSTLTVGASGLVFGWLTFLVVRGVFTRNVLQIVIGLVLLAGWGGVFWGVLPGANGISWQAHLFGAIGGVLAAFLTSKADGPARAKPVAA